MLISEAVKKAMNAGGMITREEYSNFGIKPTGACNTLMILSLTRERPPAKAWQPLADDLIADNWKVID